MDAINKLLEKLKNPALAAGVALVLGFVIGLVWGWVVQPVEWVDATPDLMNANYQREYLRMTIDSFLVNSDTTLALQRWQNLGPDASQRLKEISDNPGPQSKAAIDGFAQLMNAAVPAEPVTTEAAGVEEPVADGGMTPTLRLALIVVGVIVIGAVAFLALRVLRPLSSKSGSSPIQQGMKHSQSIEKTDYAEMGLATPITQLMTTYVIGDDLYDESFEIESQSGEHLGEYGVDTKSTTIGVGSPNKVTAMEVWLFDQHDIQNTTKLLLSEHAFSNPELVERFKPKGELVPIRLNEPVKLETKNLQLLVTVVDLAYGSGPQPPNSYFDRVTLELAVWPKQAPVAAG